MINKVILVGRLTKDVELRKTMSGVSVTQYSLAVERDFKDQNGNKQTDYINCVTWRQSAEFLQQYTRKGDLIGVTGSLQVRTYDRQDGTRAYVSEVITESVNILGHPQNAPQQNNQPAYNPQQNAPYQNQQQAYNPKQNYTQQQQNYRTAPQQNNYPQQQYQQNYSQGDAPGLQIDSDDLPF